MNVSTPLKTSTLSSALFAFSCLVLMSLSLSVQAKERGENDMPKHERPEFSSLDLDSDGSVTYAEFEQSKVPNDDHTTIFGHIDANGDGVLTKEEFTSHKPPRRQR